MSLVFGPAAFVPAAGGNPQSVARHPAPPDGDAPRVHAATRTAAAQPLRRNWAIERARLAALGEKMCEAARRQARSVGMLILQMEDLAELEVLFGARAAHEVVRRAAAELTELAADGGLVLRTAADTLTLLTPGHDAEDLLDGIEARLGKSCAIDFELDHEEIVIVPDVLARRVRSGETVAQAYDTLCHDLVHQRSCAQRRHDYLRRERESHTGPQPEAARPAPAAEQASTVRLRLA